MNTDAYLERIGYRGSLDPDAETLRQLQLAHLRSVPFENLSIHAGEPIVLADEALFAKIVMRRRGGWSTSASATPSWNHCDRLLLMRSENAGPWLPQYRFPLTPRVNYHEDARCADGQSASPALYALCGCTALMRQLEGIGAILSSRVHL